MEIKRINMVFWRYGPGGHYICLIVSVESLD